MDLSNKDLEKIARDYTFQNSEIDKLRRALRRYEGKDYHKQANDMEKARYLLQGWRESYRGRPATKEDLGRKLGAELERLAQYVRSK